MTEIILIALGVIIIIGLAVYFKIKTPPKIVKQAPTRDDLVIKLMDIESKLGQLDTYRQVEVIARNETRQVKDKDIQAQFNLYLNDQINKRIKMEQDLFAEKDKLIEQLKEMNQIGQRPTSANIVQLDMQDNSN